MYRVLDLDTGEISFRPDLGGFKRSEVASDASRDTTRSGRGSCPPFTPCVFSDVAAGPTHDRRHETG